MTKQEYNNQLKRFNKAMDWFDTKPPEAEIEKFWVHFTTLLEFLRVGTLELNPTAEEMTRGFIIGTIS